MLIYVSPNKIKNLLEEMEITENLLDHFMTVGGDSIRISGNKHGIKTCIEFPFHEKEKNSKDIIYILKSLKNKGKLSTLTANTRIANLSYISTIGTLEYIKYENGYTASMLNEDDLNRVRPNRMPKSRGTFFDDDVLIFKIRISHEQYDDIIIKCTAGNIQVFGASNLNYYYPDLFKDSSIWLRRSHSGDPGILHRQIAVECVVWILDTNPNNRSIIGSPLIIYC